MSKSLQKKRGIVVSKSGDKTVKVSVKTRKRHPFYKKVVNVTWSALVHDETNGANVGDHVTFVSCRPLSAKKRWRIVEDN
ncbi:MAG: 30S ribosomal protein S17 [Candidatus Marinamargulisbacteria bacterium]